MKSLHLKSSLTHVPNFYPEVKSFAKNGDKFGWVKYWQMTFTFNSVNYCCRTDSFRWRASAQSCNLLWLLMSWRRLNGLLPQKALRFWFKNHPTCWTAAYFIWETKIWQSLLSGFCCSSADKPRGWSYSSQPLTYSLRGWSYGLRPLTCSPSMLLDSDWVSIMWLSVQ